MDDNTPATKADIHAVKADLLRLEMRLERTLSRKFNEGIDQVLTVLVNMDKRLSGTVQNHESRITKLEQAAA